MALPITVAHQRYDYESFVFSSRTEWIIYASVATDATVFITSLVLGILGLMNILAIPPTACYCLLALTGIITLSYLVLIGRPVIDCASEVGRASCEWACGIGNWGKYLFSKAFDC